MSRHDKQAETIVQMSVESTEIKLVTANFTWLCRADYVMKASGWIQTWDITATKHLPVPIFLLLSYW